MLRISPVVNHFLLFFFSLLPSIPLFAPSSCPLCPCFGRVVDEGDGLEIHWDLPAQVRILPTTNYIFEFKLII